MKELKGVCVALCTPFDESGEKLDETALRNHMDSMLEAGVHIILVCGGTGEFAYLRPEERKRIAEIASKHIDGRAGFMVQTSAINTADAIEFAKHAEGVGADALLILPPYFEGPNDDGVYYHFEKISEAINTPIMVYNIPECSGFDVTPALFKRLLEIDNVRYIKDSMNDLVRIQELLAVAGDRAGVFNGGDGITYFSLVAGCPGCVWGATNAMPKESVELYDLVVSGKLVEATALWKRMFPANLFFLTHVYNAAVKAATNLSGRKVGPCRKPVLPLTDSEMAELKEALKPLGI
ncbi:MAG: dihydrodipicolinate synthase family protein [Deltaproteobacteria bacterium]|nr:dihydrodipicolinate synthase family protein [Deltaproteobacteria bacterium]MBW2122429.1 dihydrodipicolinate synthase family protein [Deltaproteobacteria bacterium]